MTETWKDIPGWEGFYQASDQGRIRSVDRHDSLGRLHRSQIKKTRNDPSGYPQVDLFKGGRSKNGKRGLAHPFKVHKLIALTFLGEPPVPEEGQGRVEVCHLDGSRDNNKVENLTWGTTSDNRHDAVAHGTHYNTKKNKCPKGHKLDWPNLTKSGWSDGRRNCLACNRARATIKQHGDLDLDKVADRHYENILGDNRVMNRKDFL